VKKKGGAKKPPVWGQRCSYKSDDPGQEMGETTGGGGQTKQRKKGFFGCRDSPTKKNMFFFLTQKKQQPKKGGQGFDKRPPGGETQLTGSAPFPPA